MKKNIITDIVCLLLILTIIGIPIAIYLLRKNEDYGKSDKILKPTKEVTEKKYEEEKRKFSPLYTKTTILPVLTEEDLEKYIKEENKESKKDKPKEEIKEVKKVTKEVDKPKEVKKVTKEVDKPKEVKKVTKKVNNKEKIKKKPAKKNNKTKTNKIVKNNHNNKNNKRKQIKKKGV